MVGAVGVKLAPSRWHRGAKAFFLHAPRRIVTLTALSTPTASGVWALSGPGINGAHGEKGVDRQPEKWEQNTARRAAPAGGGVAVKLGAKEGLWHNERVSTPTCKAANGVGDVPLTMR